jgi:hypothetical protein
MDRWKRVNIVAYIESKKKKALPTKGKDIVLRFIIEYSSLMDFGP